MPSSSSSATPLTFDAFWRWLLEHRNCVVRLGSGDVALMDHDLIHWDFFDEEDGRAVCQYRRRPSRAEKKPSSVG